MTDSGAAWHGESGEALFLSQLALIERVTRLVAVRHHLSAADADDFGSHVKLKLVEQDYAVLRKFQGRSSLRTYLTIVIQRLFLDYRISAWGKWRPSAEARRLGPVGVLLERLLVRDGHSFDEACELLASNHRVAAARMELERLAARLPVRLKRRFESDEVLTDVASAERAPDEAVAGRERQEMANRVAAALPRLMRGLDPQDQLVLTMRFEDGRTVADIAELLRVDQKALYRRCDRLLRELRAGLEAGGIQADAVMEMLESADVTIEWERAGAGNAPPSPSMGKGAQQWR